MRKALNKLALSITVSMACITTATAETSVCTLLTRGEVTKAVGDVESDGKEIETPGGNVCKWQPKSINEFAYVQILPPDLWAMPSTRKGYRELKGIGDRAYIARAPAGNDSWVGGAKAGNKVIIIQLPGATEAAAVELLKTAFGRM